MSGDAVKVEAEEVGMRLDYRHMAVKVSFCSDFSHVGELVLAPLGQTGFMYPLPHIDISPSAVQEITGKLAFGNAVDFGLDSAGRKVFGLYVGESCDWNDIETLSKTIQYSIYHLSQSLPAVNTAVIAPLGENLELEPLNYCLYQSFCSYYQPQRLLLPVQSQLSKDCLKRIFTSLSQSGYSLRPPITRTDLEDIMKSSKLNCALCKEYAENAVMTQCCQVLACGVCAQYCQHCPDCSQSARWMENKQVRKQVKDEEYVCKCEESMLVGEVSDHLRSCTFSQFRCRVCKHGDIYTKSDLLEHLKASHSDFITSDLPISS